MPARRPTTGSVQGNRVAEYIIDSIFTEIRKFAVPRAYPFTLETAFIEHPKRWRIFRMTQRVKTGDSCISCDFYHGPKRFGSVSLPPRVFSKYIAGRRTIRCFEAQPSAAQQHVVLARFDEIRSHWPSCPLHIAEGQKRVCRLHRAVARPCEQTSHVRVVRITSEDSFGIVVCWLPKNESLFQPVRRFGYSIAVVGFRKIECSGLASRYSERADPPPG